MQKDKRKIMAPKAEEEKLAGEKKLAKEEEKKKLTKEEKEKKKAEEELSEEDKQLKEELELCVTRLSESNNFEEIIFKFCIFQPRVRIICGSQLWSQ